MTSKLLTLSADAATATVASAEVLDIFTTVLSTDKALTGTYGLVQKLGLVGVGMSIQNYRKVGSLNPFD